MERNKIISQLNICADACDSCYNACINEGDISSMIRCMELTRECSEICRLTASIVSRNSENKEKFLKFCYKICETCAEECERHNAEYCRQCAEICRKRLEVSYDFHPMDYIF